MVKIGCRGETVLASLLDLVHTVWEEGEVLRDWLNAVTSATVITGKGLYF